MLVKQVGREFGDRVRFRAEDFGNSPLGDRLGVRQYPAVFIDDVLVATPRDFYAWGTDEPGRYTPWSEASSRQKFVDDLMRMLEVRLGNGLLESRELTEVDRGTILKGLPEITLTDLEGRSLETSDLAGRLVLVEFWASWCPPCQGTLDWLFSLPERYGDDLAVLALAVQSDEDQVRTMSAGNRSSARVVMTSTQQAEAFSGVMAVPTLMLFDREGRLASVFYGAPPDLHDRVENDMAGLLAAKKGKRQNDATP